MQHVWLGAAAQREHVSLQVEAVFVLLALRQLTDSWLVFGVIEQAWDGDGTGLIVSERLVNCPPQLAPPLVKGLFDEISAAAKAKVRLVRHADSQHRSMCQRQSHVPETTFSASPLVAPTDSVQVLVRHSKT